MKRYSGSITRSLAVSVFALLVVLAAPVKGFGQGGEVPKPAVDLKAGTAHYNVRLEAGGKVVTMDLTRTTKAQNGVWVVTETTRTGGRIQTDETTLEKKTLVIRSRLFRAESEVADLKFDGHKATGTITDGKETHVVNADVGGVVFADGGSGGDVMAALPLARNYSAEFRNFNIGSEQAKMLQLRVMDDDTVSVPAGTFDTWKVLITSLDGGSDTYALWVEKRTHRLIKVAISVPNLNNALATAELTK